MNDDRLESLLWERLDGTISDEDLAELEAHLAEHPRPRQLEREINKLAEILEDDIAVEPPSELRGQINSALKSATPPVAKAQTISTQAKMPRWLPLAASLVIGIAIGYIMSTGSTGLVDPAQVTGAMTTVDPASAVEFTIDLDAELGAMQVARSAQAITFELNLEPGVDIKITVLTADGRSIELDANGPGAQRLQVVGEEDSVDLVVRANGRLVAERRIDPVSTKDKP